jgi:hypothetical protein
VERHGCGEVFQLLAKAVSEPVKSLHKQPRRAVEPFNVASAYRPRDYAATYRFDTEGDARTMEAGMRCGLQKMVQETREGMVKDENEKEKASASAIIALLEQAQIETRQTENGWKIDVRLNGPVDIESSLGL